MKKHACAKYCVLIPLAIAAFLALIGYAVYALWNGVLVEVLPVRAVTYWQAVGLLVLAKLLFGGFPHREGKGCDKFRFHLLAKQSEAATPEEREKIRREIRLRFGDWPSPHGCGYPEDDEPGKTTKTPGV